MSVSTSKKWRMPWLVAAAAGCLIALTACSSGGSAMPGPGAASGGPTKTQLASMQQLAAEYTGVPKFVAPGPAFSVASLKGKKVMVMPTASQLPPCEAIAKNTAKLAESVGMKATVFDNAGGPQAWIPGVQQATSQKYAALVLVCGIDPNLIKPQIEAAKAAGVAVIDSGLGDADLKTPNDGIVTASTDIGEGRPYVAAAGLAFLAAKGKPIHFLEWTSNDIPSSVVMSKGFHKLVADNCPGCKITSINVPSPDWGTKLQPAIASALTANPDITVIMATFDAVPPIEAAIKGSGNKNVRIYGATGGTAEYIAQMGASDNKMMTNVASSVSWRAYAAADLMFRVVSGASTPDPWMEADGMRIFTPESYKESADASVGYGYGTEYPKDYESLWLGQ